MKRLVIIIFTLLFVGVFSLDSEAGDFDGTRPLICAIFEITECDMGKGCKEVSADEINLPRFLRINVSDKIIEGKTPGGEMRTTRIERVEEVDNKLIIQGAEQGREGVQDGFGWTIAIMEDTGDMVLTASGDLVGLVAFGACTPR